MTVQLKLSKEEKIYSALPLDGFLNPYNFYLFYSLCGLFGINALGNVSEFILR